MKVFSDPFLLRILSSRAKEASAAFIGIKMQMRAPDPDHIRQGRRIQIDMKVTQARFRLVRVHAESKWRLVLQSSVRPLRVNTLEHDRD